MIHLPKTIKYPEKFQQSKPANFDGVFDWSWTDGCFGETKIRPTDIDAIIERHGNFLVMETKDIGIKIPEGQLITFKALHELGCFTVMLIWGKTSPENFQVWYPRHVCDMPQFYKGIKKAREVVSRWYEYANKQLKTPGF